MTPRAAILVPAYNEATVIGETLSRLTCDMRSGEFQIIVIANACHDDTAEIARKVAPDAVVLETKTPGKTNALRMGLDHVAAPVVVFLDADLGVDADAIRQLIAPLQAGGALASYGRMSIDLDGCSRSVRSFYEIWTRRPYLKDGKFGGLFAVARGALNRALPLPDLIADDEYFSRCFQPSEKAFVSNVEFVARAPRQLGDLFKVRKRSTRGTRELAAMGLSRPKTSGAGGRAAFVSEVIANPKLWADFLIYSGLKVAVRLSLVLEGRASGAGKWERDDSSRIVVSG
ncbi:glycosyltransferase [Phaeobacter marinintestinus]|uniref:glycosyltransferase n=1 Tax=Falsiphaeobacter marinintestinus TaxID=1492905 RepID=UPI0011B64060|nr:glycosyltransferase [Phaeobacter marinintestinus]